MALESWQIAALPGADQTPPTTPPPQMPPQPPLPSQQRSAAQIQADLKLHYIKPRRPWIVPLLVFIALAIIASGGWLLVQKYRNNPTPLFNQALTTSLATKQLVAVRSGDADTTTTMLDVTKPRDPRMSTLTTKVLGADTYVKGYGTLRDTFVVFASDPTKKTDTPTNLLDQWIGIRSDNELPNGAANTPLFTMSDPRSQLLQPWVFGNFDEKTRNDLLAQIKKSKLYEFDAKKVTHDTKDNQTTYVYPITIEGTKLAAYEAKAGDAFGIPASDVSASTRSLIGGKVTMHLYVNGNTKQVTRIDVTTNGITSSTIYANYNKVTLPAAPVARFTYSQYLSQLGVSQ